MKRGPELSARVVVTGSSSGLGLATARVLLQRGAGVVLCSNAQDELADVARDLSQQYGDRVLAQPCDIRAASQVQQLLDRAVAHFGHLDAWINNAGTTAPSGPVSRVPITAGRLLLDVNIIGTYHGSIAAVRHFCERGAGRLINIVGRGESSPVAGAALYGSSKAWVRQFTLALAKDEPGLEIGTFNPGLLYTALTAQPRVLADSEDNLLKGLKFIMPLIGDTPEPAAQRLAQLVLGKTRLKLENRSRRLLPFVLKRLLTGQRAHVDVDAIEAQVTPPQDGSLV